ncbi:MAG: ABC transporter permease [Candidatus Cloacimonetes bacterium]|nr:ABC transporter permease [Candidatus Cloacimonadota bacterium]
MLKTILFFLRSYLRGNRIFGRKSDLFFLIAGIVISVATLTIATTLFEGYEKTLKKSILGINSHIYFFKDGATNINQDNLQQLTDYLKVQKEVTAFSPLLMSSVMATNKGRIKGALLRGIDWKADNPPTNYREYVKSGSTDLSALNTAVIGVRLAEILNVNIGDSISLVSPSNSTMTPVGLKHTQIDILITGIFDSGMYEYDNTFIFANYETAFQFQEFKEFSMIEVKLDQKYLDETQQLARKWRYESGGRYQVQTWIDYNGNLFSLLKLEKWVLFFILTFLIVIASFNVISFTLASVLDKKREIGILKSFGASGFFLKQLFLGKALLISLLSVLLGQFLGIVLAFLLTKQSFLQLKGDVYFIDRLTISLNPFMMLSVFMVSMLIILLFSYLPLRRIDSLQITDVIRK